MDAYVHDGWMDGCHSLNCCLLTTLHYTTLLYSTLLPLHTTYIPLHAYVLSVAGHVSIDRWGDVYYLPPYPPLPLDSESEFCPFCHLFTHSANLSPYIYLSVCLSYCLSHVAAWCAGGRPSVCLPVCLSACLPVCLSVCLRAQQCACGAWRLRCVDREHSEGRRVEKEGRKEGMSKQLLQAGRQ